MAALKISQQGLWFLRDFTNWVKRPDRILAWWNKALGGASVGKLKIIKMRKLCAGCQGGFNCLATEKSPLPCFDERDKEVVCVCVRAFVFVCVCVTYFEIPVGKMVKDKKKCLKSCSTPGDFRTNLLHLAFLALGFIISSGEAFWLSRFLTF